MEMETLPAWDLTSEYPSLQSDKFISSENQVEEILGRVDKLTAQAKSQCEKSANGQADEKLIGEILKATDEGQILLYDLSTYLMCSASIDAKDEAIKAKSAENNILITRFTDAATWIELYMIKASEEHFQNIMKIPAVASQKFIWSQTRKTRDHVLPESEESLLTGVGLSGFHAWADLYSNLSGTMKVPVEMQGKTEELGLAHASALVRGTDPKLRKAAWLGIQKAWKTHQEAAAAILNSLAGWRLELYKRRSHKKPMHFLDEPLLGNRIEKKTLDAMMSALKNNLPATRQTLKLMAKAHKTEKMNPWDLLATPADNSGESATVNFSEAIRLIKKSFAKISPDMTAFVDKMVSEKRLEGRVLENKSHGGYCATFKQSRMPVVFQTYMGSSRDVFTLVHELGHAYHSWILKDIPFSECRYPMTLAETASIFAETLLSEDMFKNSTSKQEKIKYAFNNLEQISSLLINIPARFEFEKNFYEKRQERSLSAKELCELSDQAWTTWYGDALSENDKMFWASKLHFSLSGTSFYNFPYTFGYLFALSIYARREELGSQFHQKYCDILRDTGRMTAEDLIMKHLGEDIRQEGFWQKAINICLNQIEDYKKLAI